MENLGDLVKEESDQTIELLLESHDDTDDDMCAMPTNLTETEGHEDLTEGALSVSEQSIPVNMELSHDESGCAVSIHDMSSLSGVDIITLQHNQMAPMFQLMSSGDGSSYMQLTDATGMMQGLGSDTVAHKIIAGQMIQLEDGTTGFIQTGLPGGGDVQSVVLEDGSTAYISLFGENGTVSMNVDTNPQHELRSPLQVVVGGEEDSSNHGDESLTSSISHIKQEMRDDSDDDDPNDDAINSESDTSTNPGQPHVSYRALQLGDKAFRCNFPDCGRLYTTQHHLKIHSRSHTGDKPFRCEFPSCGKAFATGYGLKSHTRVHTGEKPYRCSEPSCSKAFKTSGDLQKHIRTHTGEKPFKCPFEGCNRMFTTSNIRKVHIRTHTGERPYVCEEDGCNKSFASATNYKNHIRIHTGEKPYVCTVEGCGKRFTEYSSLYKHHVVHTQSKPYICNHCHKTYRQTSTLSMHKRTIHNDHDTSLEGEAVINTIQAVQIITGNHGQDQDGESEGTLVINTSEGSLIKANGPAISISSGLEAINAGSSALLQHLQPAGIQGPSGIQQVYLIADPSQLEAIKSLSHQGMGVSGSSSSNTILDNRSNVLTVHTGEPPDDNLVAFSTDS